MKRALCLFALVACNPAPAAPTASTTPPTASLAPAASAASAASTPSPARTAEPPKPLASYDGSLPAPTRAHVVATRADGALLVYAEGTRVATARDRARSKNTVLESKMGVPTNAQVAYHAVVEPTQHCVVDTVETPALDDLSASFSQLVPQAKQVLPTVRAELDRLYTLATQFGTRQLPDLPLAFGTTAERAAFEVSSFTYLVNGLALVGYGGGAAIAPRSTPNGATMVASGCNPRCGDYLMLLLGGAPTAPTKPALGSRKPASDFWFRDDDHLVYVQNDSRSLHDATKICLHEYVVSSKRDHELRCFPSKVSSSMLEVSPHGRFVAMQLDHGTTKETKVLDATTFADAWTSTQANPYQYVDDQGRLLYDEGLGAKTQTHLISAKGEETWDGAGAVGFGAQGVVTLLPTGEAFGPPSNVSLDSVRCAVFTERAPK